VQGQFLESPAASSFAGSRSRDGGR
jgi:hypothetical protein